MTLLVCWRKPFFYFMPGYPGASRAFAIRKLLIAAACDTRIRVSQAGAVFLHSHTKIAGAPLPWGAEAAGALVKCVTLHASGL